MLRWGDSSCEGRVDGAVNVMTFRESESGEGEQGRETRWIKMLRVCAMIGMKTSCVTCVGFECIHPLTLTLTLASTVTLTATRNITLTLTLILDPDPKPSL